MPFWKSNAVEKQELEVLKRAIAASFERVKLDTQAIHSWLNSLYQFCCSFHNRQAKVEKALSEAIKKLPSQTEFRREIAKAIAYELAHHKKTQEEHSKALEELKEKLSQLEKKIKQSEEKEFPQKGSSESEFELRSELSNKPKLRAKLNRMIARGSKPYLKSVIVSLVSKWGKISAVQLREMIVEEQGLCSKSTFYRLLEELEKEKALSRIYSGREKIYLLQKSSPVASV